MRERTASSRRSSSTPLANTGFNSDGNTLAREPLTMTFDNVTGAFPNLLESLFIKGNIAYLPNTCSSPNGPFRFNVNVQGCFSAIDIERDEQAFTTLNLNGGVPFEPVGIRLFNTNPFAVAFKRSKAEGFIALGATDRLLRVTLDDQGRPSINPLPAPAIRARSSGSRSRTRTKSASATRTTQSAARTREGSC